MMAAPLASGVKDRDLKMSIISHFKAFLRQNCRYIFTSSHLEKMSLCLELRSSVGFIRLVIWIRACGPLGPVPKVSGAHHDEALM